MARYRNVARAALTVFVALLVLSLAVLGAPSAFANARDFLNTEQVLNESNAKRPGNIRFLVYTPANTPLAITSLESATEVHVKNLTDADVLLSWVSSGQTCVANGIAGNTTLVSASTRVYKLDALSDSVTLPIPRSSSEFSTDTSTNVLCAAAVAAVGNSEFLYVIERDQ